MQAWAPSVAASNHRHTSVPLYRLLHMHASLDARKMRHGQWHQSQPFRTLQRSDTYRSCASISSCISAASMTSSRCMTVVNEGRVRGSAAQHCVTSSAKSAQHKSPQSAQARQSPVRHGLLSHAQAAQQHPNSAQAWQATCRLSTHTHFMYRDAISMASAQHTQNRVLPSACNGCAADRARSVNASCPASVQYAHLRSLQAYLVGCLDGTAAARLAQTLHHSVGLHHAPCTGANSMSPAWQFDASCTGSVCFGNTADQVQLGTVQRTHLGMPPGL
jgi:hypothetical protein